MLPRSLGVELLSLSPNRENDVLTFSAKLDPEGNILEYSVFPAKVSNIKRLDYDEYDKKLNDPTNDDEIVRTLRSLMKIGDARLALRLKNGASEFVMPSPEVRVRNGIVSVQPSREFKSYTRRIVREMMILANEVSAMFANKNNITIPYRGTMGGMFEEPVYTLDDLKIDVNISEEDYIKKMIEINKWAPRRRSAKKCLTKLPCAHSGLGVQMYTQVTSPIRRYSDLLIHHLLKAKIRGEPEPMSWNELERMMMTVEPNLTMNLNLQRDSERFWICKYFSNNKDNIFKAIVIRDSKNNYNVDSFEVTVYILENGYTTSVKLENNVTCGDTILLRVVDANPYKDILIFERV
jgi:exoribonuclease-2